MSSFWRPGKNHIREIDGWRTFAVFWIFFLHIALETMNRMGEAQRDVFSRMYLIRFLFDGEYGADIFFVISGFLIGGLLMQEYQQTGRIDRLRFYGRRALRILPVYYSVILFIALMRWNTPDSYLQNIWFNVFYINNMIPSVQQFMPWAWTLAVEEQFYLICPFFIAVAFKSKFGFFRFSMGVLFGIVGVTLVVLYFADPGFRWSPIPPLSSPYHFRYLDSIAQKTYFRLVPILVGILGAYLYQRGLVKKFFETRTRFFCTASIAVVFSIFVLVFPYRNDGREVDSVLFLGTFRLIESFAIMTLMFSTFFGGLSKRVFSHPIFYVPSLLSYSIYLIHPIVIFFGLLYGSAIFFPEDQYSLTRILIFGLAMAIVTSLASIPIHLFIERPGMNARRKIPRLRMPSAT